MEPKEEMIQNPNMVQEPVLVEVQDTIQILLMIFTEMQNFGADGIKPVE